jgi:DNA-binding XRE family transcriptional regulator
MKSLAITVKEWRAGQGITQAKAAEILDMPIKTLMHIEQGREFKSERLLRLAITALERQGNGA